MPKMNAADGAAKWARNTKNAVADAKAGIQRVTTSPTEKAADNIDKMVNRLLEAVQSGKLERALRSVSLAEWKRLAEAGTARIAQGVDNKGTGKMEAFAREFYPFLERVQGEIDNMPNTTLEDSINRMTHNVRRIHEFGQGRG